LLHSKNPAARIDAEFAAAEQKTKQLQKQQVDETARRFIS